MIRDLREVDRTQVALVGGKAASLGELSRIVRVPAGLVVTKDEAVPVQEGMTYAVRSSATAEDLPTASFAGQYESYLNVAAEDVLEHVRKCRASLHTERAVAYRERQGIERVEMAVIVQEMVPADVAGVLFTADPLSGNRQVACVEAVRGLGEDLVSGLVAPDVYRVRDGAVIEAHGEALTQAQVLRLVELGQRIEAHFGRPQDIEWCLAGDEFWFVQSRAITTLFPIPPTADDAPHVWLSTGHQQMMTDAMKPLGLSMWRMTAMRPMDTAGGRLFVDVTTNLATAGGRAGMLEVMGKSDPLFRDALETVLASGFLPAPPTDAPAPPPLLGAPSSIENDPALPAEMVRKWEASLADLKRDIQTRSGPELYDFIEASIGEMKRLLTDPLSHQCIMAGHEATWWLNEHLPGVVDTLSQSVPHNVTSEMGLALLDVADALRGVPEEEFPGHPALRAFLDRYGMRCAGEIDITRPRWSEQPLTLVPLLLANIRNFAPGEGKRRFEQGLVEAERKKQEFTDEKARWMIERLRTFAGFREYPKYGIVCRLFVYKQALLREAKGNIDFLTFEELRAGVVDGELVRTRQEEFRHYQMLTPPRVLTSEGECFSGAYRRGGAPEGALVGLPVSAGVVEGRARVVRELAEASFDPDDILVTAYTDPSWTPAFLSVAGLVTEVGGLMTHGAVIAREYGLPAVVGVEGATRLIQDGQRVRVDGTNGYIELLP